MRIFSNTSIRIKVLIAPVIMIITLGVILFIAIGGMENQRKLFADVQKISMKRLQLVQEFITTSELVQSDVYRLSVLQFMQSPEIEVSPVSERLNTGLNNLTVINGEILTKWSLDQNEQALLQELKKSLDTFRRQIQQAVTAVSEDPSIGILFVRSAAIPFSELRGLLSKLLDYQNGKIEAAKQHSEAMLGRIRKTIISIAILMALIAIFITVYIGSKYISNPIVSITRLMGRLTEGDLSIKVEDDDRKDEIGQMERALNVFRNNAIDKAHADKKLQESEDRFRNLYNTAQVGLFRTAIPDGAPLQINQHYAELAGYGTVEECLRDFVASEHYADSKLRELMLKQMMQKGEVKGFEAEIIRKDNSPVWISFSARIYPEAGYMEGALVDITDRKHAEEDRDKLILELQDALKRIKTLSGMLPICSYCKNIRDDKGYWNKIESYIHKHSGTEFSHSICPECAKKYYPDMDIYDDNGEVTED